MRWFRNPVPKLLPQPADADNVLLAAFVQDSNAVALSLLVERHMAMVFRVCRSILGHEHDAEDATQAAFLVLTRRAATIRNQSSLASWLHGVALQSARSCRRQRIRERQRIERRAEAEPSGDVLDDLTLREAREILHAELDRLPERDKIPILLVYFQDRSHDEAARLLGLSLPAFRGRLERARKRLAERLARHRLSLTATMSLVLLTVNVPPAMAATMTTTLLAGTSPPAVTAAAASVVPAGSNATSSTIGLAAIAVGGLAVFIAIPLLWPSSPVAPPAAGSYPRGHIIVAIGDRFAILDPDDGKSVPLSPKLPAGKITRFRIDPGGTALAYESENGGVPVICFWRFDEPFPGVQAAREAEAFGWRQNGRLAVATQIDGIAQMTFINIATGDREIRMLPPKHHMIDIHPDGEQILVAIDDGENVAVAIWNFATNSSRVLQSRCSPANAASWRFSPSGEQVAGVLTDDSGVRCAAIFEAGMVRTIPCPEAGPFYGWSPDGSALLLRTARNAMTTLAASGTEPPRVLTAQTGWADWCR